MRWTYPIRDVMSRAGYNVARLAEAIGLSPVQMSNRLNGMVPWHWDEVQRTCKVLGLTYEQFEEYYPAA